MQRNLREVKKIANYMYIQFAQLFINGHSAHLLLHIYLSALVLSTEEKATEVIWSTCHP